MQIPEEEAMVMLLRSDLFKTILEDRNFSRMPPDELYALFAKEMRK